MFLVRRARRIVLAPDRASLWCEAGRRM